MLRVCVQIYDVVRRAVHSVKMKEPRVSFNIDAEETLKQKKI